MRNPLQTKLTDIKFSLKRLEAQCLEQNREVTRQLLEQAQQVLDQAIASAAYDAPTSSEQRPDKR